MAPPQNPIYANHALADCDLDYDSEASGSGLARQGLNEKEVIDEQLPPQQVSISQRAREHSDSESKTSESRRSGAFS
jgi:hypothetical protein